MRARVTYLRQLQKFLRRRGASREEAEDLVQEAVLRLHVYSNEGKQVRDTEAFLMRIALNLAVDARRHARADRYERESIEELNLVAVGPTPDEVLVAEQRLLSRHSRNQTGRGRVCPG